MDLGLAMKATEFAIAQAKRISDLSKKTDNIELHEAILALRESLVDLKSQHIDAKEYVLALEAQLADKNSLEFDGALYWKIDGNEKDGPYCQNCYDTEQKLVRLQHGDTIFGNWHCFACDQYY